MTTVILVGLIVVLLAAAAYVGVAPPAPHALARRAHPSPAANARGRSPTWSARRTDPADDLSGPELFVPAVPRQDGVAVPDAPEARGGRCPAAGGSPAGDAGGRHRGRRRPVAARRPDDGRRAGRGVGDRAVPGRRRARGERAVRRGAAGRRAGPRRGSGRTTMPAPAPKVGAPTGSSPSVVIVSRAAAPAAPPDRARVALDGARTRLGPQRTSRLSPRAPLSAGRPADDAASAGSVRDRERRRPAGRRRHGRRNRPSRSPAR